MVVERFRALLVCSVINICALSMPFSMAALAQEALSETVAPETADTVSPNEGMEPSAVKEPTADDSEAEPDLEDAESLSPPEATLLASSTSETDVSPALVEPRFPEAQGNGNLGYSYPLELPGFRSLEPRIALTYDSARKTKRSGLYQAWLGHGWGLSGFDVIERQRPRGGVAAFDANDVFVLNGMELVPCETGTISPSCDHGGTHATENESYRRIVFDEIANTWTITDRDGTRTVLETVEDLSGTAVDPNDADAVNLGRNYMWRIASTIDMQGNAVSYAYDCALMPVCVPTTVTYGEATITFHWEDRPDKVLMANGLTISRHTQRIKTIEVAIDGAVHSVVALTYEQETYSQNSMLTQIDRYGTDATV